MASLKETVELLEDLFDLIVRAKTNYKKSPKSRLTKGYIETRLQALEDYWISFKNAHQTLIQITTKEQRVSINYFKEEKYSECEEIYLDLKTEMIDAVELFTTKKEEVSEHTPRTEGTRSTEVRLPTLNLPSYAGAYEDWQSFEDTFRALIHTNKSLSQVQKFHYLKSCLSGEAMCTIKHIKVTERHYEEAWNTLRNRYNQKRLIVNETLKKFYLFRKMNAQSSAQLKSLIDGAKGCLTSLNAMDINTSTWDPIMIFLTVTKLDNDTHQQWESHVSREFHTDLATMNSLTAFLEEKIQTLELTSPTSSNTTQRTQRIINKERTFHTTSTNMICKLCNGEHLLCHCREFAKLDPSKRSEVVKTQRLCYNCLSSGHPIYHCKQKTSCKICGKRHHSLLHYCKKEESSKDTEKISASPGISSTCTNDDDIQEEEDPQDETIVSNFTRKQNNALLATALVPVKSENGRETLLRALIDPGSQASFISEHATQLIQLKKTPTRGSVIGVGSLSTSIRHTVQLNLMSRYDKEFNHHIRAYVLKSITSTLPRKNIQQNIEWSHLDGLALADPQYFVSSKIDLLLGIEVYTEIVKNNLIKGPQGTPTAQETNLGWILFGNIHDQSSSNTHLVVMHHRVDIDMDHLLKKLWVIDDDTKNRKLTSEERTCEEIYEKEHSRTTDGRYIVKLPFKRSPEEVGQTRDTALKRLEQIERKLERNPKLKEEYSKVMEEYIQLNHMEKVPKEEKENHSIYLPHHAVIKDSETTKVRIVFDASCKGSNNVSLNDLLFVGPQLQEDLRNLIMRWRMKEICFTSDICKMYRMILVKKEDADCQRVLWRENPTNEVEDYRMLRVTFGTASAPYLAIKTLKQLSQDEHDKFPVGTKILAEDFYVDDCLSGDHTLEGAVEASRQLQQLLEKGGFVLQKWASNSKEFLEQIPQSLRSTCVEKGITDESIIKTLGISWNMTTDSFHYQTRLPSKPTFITKRSILADVQSLFDPLGWISPAIITAKMLIQNIWKQRLDWDETIDQIDEEEWIKLRQSFEMMDKIQIKRWIYTHENTNKLNIHGYCDASTKGYCAVVYYRVETQNDIKTGIIASRTKVAPLKTISLPRLELCGAVLLAKLLTQVREAMRLNERQIFAWTDSTIVLSWLVGDPNRWKPFVSNRVVEILDNVSVTQWFHVKSKENPADIGSRGTNLHSLIENKLWWEGPEWLKNKNIDFTKPNIPATDIEMKNIALNIKFEEDKSKLITEEMNTLQELLIVIVYSLRFIYSKKRTEDIDKPITTNELQNALIKCILITQKEEFNKEIEALRNKRNVTRESTLRSLNPYLDENNIVRVGGRLRNADVSDDQKHPVILGNRSHFARLIVAEAHQKTLHGGIQLMLSYIKSKYWIIKVKNLIKTHIHKCIICARHKSMSRTQLMGDLPNVRTTPSRAFLHSGIDFAGPLQVLMSKGRGAKTNKAYIAVFICMSTKAIHLELVGDLTSEAFIGAFNRFVSRRGRCLQIWSDHGRNFVGANKELQEAWKEANLQLPGHLTDILAADGTQWNFIPPYSPNFGGLWEAAVKSTKFHLKRILNTSLTFEETSTILCQIEACLNSRPLVPIDTSDTEWEILTPGHFLIGEAPIAIPNPNLQDISVSKLSRWQHTQRLVASFWHRWQNEYLTRLQARTKWMRKQKEFEIGDIVLLREDQLPPGKWAIGRIVAKHPGEDNLTRVYSIKCRSGVVKRSLSRICALPIDKD